MLVRHEAKRGVSAAVWSQGDIPVERIRKHLADLLNEPDATYYRWLQQEWGPLLEAIRESAPIRRLRELRNLGPKVVPTDFLFARSGEAMEFAPHTRFQHVHLCAELALFAAAKLHHCLDDGAAGVLVGGAYLHDLGHPAFCHAGDDLLIRHGFPPHEAYTYELLQSPEIDGILRACQVNPQLVLETAKETGRYGRLQSVLDTLSYLVVDSALTGLTPLFPDFGGEVIADLVGLTDTGEIIVKHPDLWRLVLQARAVMFRDVYKHPVNRMTCAASERLLEIAVERGVLSLEEVRQGTDASVGEKIRSLRTDGTDSWFIRELLAMFSGRYQSSRWQQRYYSDARQLPEHTPWSLVLYPLDFRTKQIMVRTPDGRRHHLRARGVKLRQMDRCFTVCTPRVRPV